MDEKKIMELITSEYSWEQVIYKIIAWEGLDPWNLDLKVLSGSFVGYLVKMKELDFKIPAKYLIIAAVLLRMKSDHLQYIGDVVAGYMKEDETAEDVGIEDVSLDGIDGVEKFEVTPVTVPPKRHPRRKIMITELVTALRSVLRTEKRRKLRKERRRGRIEIKEDRITERIDSLYRKINEIMEKLKSDEVKFSSLVGEWRREEVVNTFLPVVYLDHARKIDMHQKEMFDEIYIRRREGKE
jgi:chromatin segregation and condensation protein Rec8/ScpA/Scc1 (kleisin family)